MLIFNILDLFHNFDMTNPEHLIEKAIRYGGKNQFIGVGI